jgi:hypothetical protein
MVWPGKRYLLRAYPTGTAKSITSTRLHRDVTILKTNAFLIFSDRTILRRSEQVRELVTR